METRILLLAALLATAGCAQHRVATAPPASAPASAIATAPATATATATTATATTASRQSRPLPQAQPEPRFYTPTEQQPLNSASVQGGQPVQPVQPLGQPAGQANAPAQNAYNTPPQGYAPSGLNSDPNNPSGAPGYSPLHGF